MFLHTPKVGPSMASSLGHSRAMREIEYAAMGFENSTNLVEE